MNKTLINSLPKSGTNLVAKCLDIFGYKQKGHFGATINLNNKLLNLIANYYKPQEDNGFISGIDSPILKHKFFINYGLNNLTDKQYITAHNGYNDDLIKLLSLKEIKGIIVIRDPRAIIASSVKYISQLKKHPFHNKLISIKEKDRYLKILNGFTSHNRAYKSVIERYQSINTWLDNNDILKIKFEEIIGPKGGGDITLMDDTLHNLCDFINIDKNKIEHVKKTLFGPGRVTFRKGQINSWQEEIPKDIQTIIEKELEFILDKLNY